MLLFPGRDSIRALFIAIPLLLTALPLSAQSARIELSAAIVEASNDFLSSLNTAQREKASFSFDDEERLNWHFIPRARQGIPLKELNPRQLLSARTLLQTLLSAKGFQKAENVRDLENVLAELETNGSFSRDPELYYLSVFGVPEMQGRWAVRYEWHIWPLTGRLQKQQESPARHNFLVVIQLKCVRARSRALESWRWKRIWAGVY